MNKRIRKKQNRVKKVSLNKLFEMSFDERVKYFQDRKVKQCLYLFKLEWAAAQYELVKYKYEASDEEWEEIRSELAKTNIAYIGVYFE